MSRYKAYSVYVPSDTGLVDELPIGWRMLRGKYVFSEYSERSEAGEEQLLSVSEYYGVKPRGEVIEEGDFLSRAESLVGYKKCQKNDLVMNIMLAWKCGLGVSKYDGIVSPAYSVFRFNGNAVPDYMHYLLRTETYTGHFKTRSTGVIDSRLRLYPESFGDVSIILPPTGEQEKIVAFLDHETAKIDALIEKQQRLIELLKEKRQAVISHAVTKGLNPNALMKDSGVEWLGEVPAHWSVSKAKYVADVFVPQRNKPDLNEEEGLAWATMDDMKNTYIVEAKQFVTAEAAAVAGSKVLEAGSVIASCVGNFGIAAINKIDVIINQQLQAYIPKKIVAEYLRETIEISRSYFEMIGTTATLVYVNQQGFENLPLSIPPICEQQDICKFLAEKSLAFERLILKCEEAIKHFQERRTALISAAVTGKIDVRDWQPAAA